MYCAQQEVIYSRTVDYDLELSWPKAGLEPHFDKTPRPRYREWWKVQHIELQPQGTVVCISTVVQEAVVCSLCASLQETK